MQPNQILLYVKDIAASKAFYSGVLDTSGIASTDTFHFFPLSGGWSLALLSQDSPTAASTDPSAGFELVFELPDRESVDPASESWKAGGATIVEPPTEFPFGYAFLATDPDGHRLRVGYFPQG